MMLEREMMYMEQEVEKLFEPLFKEFNVFFKREENEVGCLNGKQHKKMMSIYNDVDTIFMQVLNGEVEQLPPQSEMASSSVIVLNENLLGRDSMGRQKRIDMKMF